MRIEKLKLGNKKFGLLREFHNEFLINQCFISSTDVTDRWNHRESSSGHSGNGLQRFKTI